MWGGLVARPPVAMPEAEALYAEGPIRVKTQERHSKKLAADAKEQADADAAARGCRGCRPGVWSKWECHGGPEKGECEITEGGDRGFWRQNEPRVLFLVLGRPC